MQTKKLRGQIMTASRDGFELLIAAVMEGLVPRFAVAKRLGDRDRLGIDVFQYDEETGVETVAVQAKTVEREIQDRHIAAFRKEISKFLKRGPVVDEYWFVINKPLKEKSHREALEVDLQNLVVTAKVRRARLFDLEPFLGHLEALARAKLVDWADALQNRLRDDYARRLEVVAYIPEVQFKAAETYNAPANWIVSRGQEYLRDVPDAQNGEFRNPPRFLIASSFGFGKTSTLHAVAARWIAEGGHALYIPAVLLPQTAFEHGSGLADGVLKAIAPPEFDWDGPTRQLLRDTLRRDLASSRNWLLLIDAIDESPYWSNQIQLAALWAGVAALGIPVVVSVREEVYASRSVEFSYRGVRKSAGEFFQRLTLLDWSPALITRFLEAFARQHSGPTPPAFLRFQDAVADGRYEDLYGDIPRRPLFLGMLAQDAWDGAEPERDLAKLYDKYFRSKLMHDWYSASAEGRAVRAGAITNRHGYEDTIERMMLAMQAVAAAIFVQADPAIPPGAIASRDLERCLHAALGAPDNVEEALLISVLKPAGRHPGTRDRLYSFAHQSFLDWFVAKALVANSDSGEALPAANAAVSMFVTSLRDAE